MIPSGIFIILYDCLFGFIVFLKNKRHQKTEHCLMDGWTLRLFVF